MSLNMNKLHELRYQDRFGEHTALVYGQTYDDCIQTISGQLCCHRARMVRESDSLPTSWKTLGSSDQVKVLEVLPFPARWHDQSLVELERLATKNQSEELTEASYQRMVQLLIDTRDYCLYSPRTERIRGDIVHVFGSLGKVGKTD